MSLVAGPVLALGLGNIQVRSHLDEPFSAVIPLTVDSPSDLDGLSVSLGSEQAFRRLGIEETDVLSSLHFTVHTQGNRSEVVVKSDKPVREPFLNFLVQAQWNGGTLMREYTVLMNPPDLSAGASSAPTVGVVNPAASSVQTPVVAPQTPAVVHRFPPRPRHGFVVRPKPGASAGVQSAAGAIRAAHTSAAASGGSIASGSRYGPVKSGETLWSIAKRSRPGTATSMDQVLLSIYDANRGAFDQGRINGLRKGSMLEIPSAANMRAIPATDAAARIHALRSSHTLKTRPEQVPAESAAPIAVEPIVPEPVLAAPVAIKPAVPEPVPATSVAIKPVATAVSPPAAAASSAMPDVASNNHSTASAVAKAATSPSAANAAPAAAASISSGDVPAKSQAVPLSSRSAHSVAAPAAVSPAVASSVAKPGVAAGVTRSVAPATAVSTSVPTTLAATKKPASKLAPTRSRTVVVPHPPHHQIGFLERWHLPSLGLPGGLASILEQWRLPLLGLLVVVLLLALLLRGRRKRVGQDEGFTPPERPPIGPKLVPSQAATGGGPTASEARPSGLGGSTTVAGVAGTVAAETALSRPAGHGQAALRDHDESFDQTARGDAQILDMGQHSAAGVDSAIGMGSVEDPLAEADFHLAYGLYDEAIQLLRNALVQTPERMDLKLKLAECYAAAGQPAEYQKLAHELQPEVSLEQWSHLAETGRKLCPGVALFGAAQAASTQAHGPLAVAEADAVESAPFGRGGNTEPGQTPGDNVIDFDLSQMEPLAGSLPDPVVAAPPVPAEARNPEVTPDLSDFDGFSAPPMSADGHRVDFKLDAIDLSEPSETGMRPVRQEPAAEGLHAIGDDEFATKLDLARAYSDMGDNESARSLLEEVVQGGDAAQKREAEALARQLAG